MFDGSPLQTFQTSAAARLHRTVRAALSPPAGAVAASVAIGITSMASAAPFPPVFQLGDLLPAFGGDGSEGFVALGYNGDLAGRASVAGDINGDGIDDLLISSTGTHSGGNTFVVFGTSGGFPARLDLERLHPRMGGDGSAGFIASGMQLREFFGYSRSAAGDVNGDGIDDIVIGAYGGGSEYKVGRTCILFGRTAPFPAILPLTSLLTADGGDGSEGSC